MQCRECYVLLHLSCIQQWARSSKVNSQNEIDRHFPASKSLFLFYFFFFLFFSFSIFLSLSLIILHIQGSIQLHFVVQNVQKTIKERNFRKRIFVFVEKKFVLLLILGFLLILVVIFVAVLFKWSLLFFIFEFNFLIFNFLIFYFYIFLISRNNYVFLKIVI